MCSSKGNARPTVPHQRRVQSGREPPCGELRAALPRGRECTQALWSPEWGWGCGRRSCPSCKKGTFTRQTRALASQEGTVNKGAEAGSEWPLEARAGVWAAGEMDPSKAGEWGAGASQSLEERRARVLAPRGRPPLPLSHCSAQGRPSLYCPAS